ncbi:MAG: T9SS type A sorting domain-containing protein [Vicingaceae bacterium]|nr:T9SS type A sorting domain-containing protein [Vicingaceae bacterium]
MENRRTYNTTVKETFVLPVVGAAANRMGSIATSNKTPTKLAVPTGYELISYPNPFNDNTTIRTILPENSTNAYLVIKDVAGKEMYRKALKQGVTQHPIDNNVVEAGIYIYYIEEAGVIILTQKLIKTE